MPPCHRSAGFYSSCRCRCLQCSWRGTSAVTDVRKAAASGSAPLIDRELFFGNPEISGAQISPDGKYIAFLKPYKDTRNIWVKTRRTSRSSAAKLVTADTKRPIPGYFWSRDGKYILFVQDKAGDENYNVYAVNPAEAPAAGQDAPAARNLTDAKGVRAIIYAVPEERSRRDLRRAERPRQGLARSLQGEDLDAASGRCCGRTRIDRRLGVRPARISCDWPSASADNGDTGDAAGRRRRLQEGLLLHRLRDAAARCAFTRTTSASTSSRTRATRSISTRLVLFDPETGKEELVESDPLNRVDFGGADLLGGRPTR